MQFYDKQFTYYNKLEVEDYLKEVLTHVAKLFEDSFEKEKTAALILIGGYGRGEGGIVFKDNHYRPHNNLDLLYIHSGALDKESIEKVDQELQKIAQKYEIGIDMSPMNKEKLLSLNGFVMHYDMRFGHRTLLGDSSFLKNHNAFSLNNIDPSEIRQLLVNRGTLLLINRAILEKGEITQEERKLIIKHSIKAIIGYGDALLYFHRKYHWSYAQKLYNMTDSNVIDEETKKLYSEAIMFRFKPNYEKYDEIDLKKWNETLLKQLSEIHLSCAKLNLGLEILKWDKYLGLALENEILKSKTLRQKVKGFLQVFSRPRPLFSLGSFYQMMGYLDLGNRGVLSLIFPYIAYEIYPEECKGFLKSLLQVKDDKSSGYLNGFLKLWAKYGDTNFKNVLRTYNIELE